MRFSYMTPQTVSVSPSAVGTLNLCNNSTQRFSLAFALNQPVANVVVTITDVSGQTIYSQTWTSGFTLSANYVRWSKITFTESTYTYSFNVFTKEINLDNNSSDDASARESESVSIEPLKVGP